MTTLTDIGTDATQAKIIATLGPASASETVISGLIQAGAEGFRLNFSHGSHESHKRMFLAVRRCAADLGRPVALIQDLQGPKLRVGSLENGKMHLNEDEVVSVSGSPLLGKENRFSVTYAGLTKDVKPGNVLLLDDGKLRMEVLEVSGEWVRCRVIEGGVLLENKGVSFPGIATSLSPVTEKDIRDLRFGMELGFDFVALSFVQNAGDLMLLRKEMGRYGRLVPIIAKLERSTVIENIDEVVAASDVIMVARGDLGIEVNIERVPVLQKKMIRTANLLGVPVITATQMLESMIVQHLPTRAEAADVANAVYDGTDMVMLSGETSIGKDPVNAVVTMRNIVRQAEAFPKAYSTFSSSVTKEDSSIAETVCRLAASTAEQTEIRAVWVYTQSGDTARIVSKCKPRVPIYGCTPHEPMLNRMAVFWGLKPILAPSFSTTESCIQWMNDRALERGWHQPGELVAVVVGSPIPKQSPTNLLKLHVITPN